MSSYRSDEMFKLATEYGIPLSPGEQEPIEDDAFSQFKNAYIEWSKERDNLLSKHLSEQPNLFRVYLPYSGRVFNLASQILWYLDEILIQDRLHLVLTNQDDLETQKNNSRKVLQFLSYFRNPIENGYILFAGTSLIKPLPEDHPSIISSLFDDSEIIDSLRSAAKCGYEEQNDNNGNRQFIFQIMLDRGYFHGGRAVLGPNEQKTFSLLPSGTIPNIKLEELIEKLSYDPFELDVMKLVCQREIHNTIYSAKLANELGAALLFDRDVDEMILKKAGSQIDEAKQIATANVLKLSLPYVRGIPPERLTILREQIPNAFLDFRSHLSEIVNTCISEGDIADEKLRERVDHKIRPQIRNLKSEINSVLTSTKIKGLGFPLVSAIGILTGSLLSVPITALIATGMAGAYGTIKAVADRQGAKEKAKGHPFYFLWKAQQRG